jgi:hypothetical protein
MQADAPPAVMAIVGGAVAATALSGVSVPPSRGAKHVAASVPRVHAISSVATVRPVEIVIVAAVGETALRAPTLQSQ